MKPSELTFFYQNSGTCKQVVELLQRENCELAISGLSGSAKALVLATIYQTTPRPMLVITPDDESAFSMAGDLKFYSGKDVLHFPGKEMLPYEEIEPLTELVAERILVVEKLSAKENKPSIIVTSIRELSEKVIPQSVISQFSQSFQFGENYLTDEIALQLAQAGYERVPLVEQRGQFAVRGGIIDIFNITSAYPVRLEFLGNSLESIRYFRVTNQRSKEEIEKIDILPAKESELIAATLEDGKPLASLLDYFSEDSLIVFDEPLPSTEIIQEQLTLAEDRYSQYHSSHKNIPKPENLYQDFDGIIDSIGKRRLIQLTILQNAAHLRKGKEYFSTLDIPTKAIETFRGQLDPFVEQLQKWQSQELTTLIVCDNPGQKDRFLELLHEREIVPQLLEDTLPPAPSLIKDGESKGMVITVGELSTGFIFQESKIVIVTDREVFTRYARVRHFRRFREGIPISDVVELQHGDYIVHIDHGIGKYLGIKQMVIDGTPGDFLTLEYEDGDKLYVPVHQINLVQKYIAREDASPKLNQLGDKSWQKAKNRAKEAIEKMAKELVELYSIREMTPGHTYSQDTVWQREFETAFIYEETPDQLVAIEEVKRDMEKPKPMDRLLCGDVGFGKTEVAIRAAFKAVMDKKQVAILVPTTILAEQHWYTFSERLADYPMAIEMLSRFKSPKDIKRIIEGIKLGTVDIVIGTHRLLSKDIAFKDLGLVIVDEEQRFGVTHKEKLKQLRKQVDVLTLTATPIPRTLYMSLSGIRDMSVINTPPEDRLPIQTYIHRYDKKIIREAILREMNRGGQIYFVHNRVESIYRIADRILEIVPQARVAIGHGQMPEKELERVMLDFISKRYDVLVSTTIIENGLDIPNVNTIIIDRADAFGLAQLYQLRGRVGRDRHQAYAYLLVPSTDGLTSIATRRLRTIQEFTDLGSGFKIAMRDLEIRGMGNVLGAQQHGHMEAIGFDLYCKMVEETIANLKGEGVPEPASTQLDLKVDAYLPNTYIEDERQKFTLYRKLAEVKSNEEVDAMTWELQDRYGEIPPETTLLLELVRARVKASSIGISYVRMDDSAIIFRWRHHVPENLLPFFHSLKSVQVSRPAVNQITLTRTKPPTKDPISQLNFLLEKVSGL